MEHELDYVKTILSEYRNMIPPVNEDVGLYKKDNELLKKELQTLEQENRMLSLKLEESLRKINSETSIPHRYSENDLLDNIKSQLNLSIKEKESVTELWKTSVRRIDYLENELKLHTAGSHCGMKMEICRIKKLYEKKIKFLQGELKSQQVKIEGLMRTSQASMHSKNRELEQILEKQRETIEHVKGLEQEMNELQERHDEVQANKVSLEVTMESKDTVINELKKQAYSAKLKVAEACQVVEAALLEKDAALAREKEAQDEITKLMTTLSEILSETEIKVKTEVNKVREHYCDEIHKFKMELKKSHEELELQCIDLEKKESTCKQLELEVQKLKESTSQFNNDNSSEKNALSRKLEDTYNKLVIAERKTTQLSVENDTLKQSLDQLVRSHESTMNNKEAEKHLLESKIRNLQNELQMSNSRLIQVALQVEDLNEKVTSVHIQLHKEYEEKTAHSVRALKGKINEIQSSNQKVNTDLRNQLEAQIKLNHKWKNEVRLVTDKLENRIQELRQELVDLRQAKKNLEGVLQEMEKKCLEYKEHLLVLCKEFNHMANVVGKQEA